MLNSIGKELYTRSLCFPNVFFPLLLTLHAIRTAATMTDTTITTATTATTAPMIAPDTFPEGPPPSVVEGSLDDVDATEVLGEYGAAELLVAMGTAY